MNPVRDLEIIQKELIAKDLAFVKKREEELFKKVNNYMKSKINTAESKELIDIYEVLGKIKDLLSNNKWVRFN